MNKDDKDNKDYKYKYKKYKKKYETLKKLRDALGDIDLIAKIPIWKPKLTKTKELGSGQNGFVYLTKYHPSDDSSLEPKSVVAKYQKMFLDIPLCYKRKNSTLFVTFLNELVISHLISQLSLNKDIMQEFYGYFIEGDNFVMVKEDLKQTFTDVYQKSTNDDKILLTLHIFVTLYETFQTKSSLLGHHGDFRSANVVIKPTKMKMRKCKIGNYTFTLPVRNGQMPVLIDFGSSRVFSYEGKSMKICRYDWRTAIKGHEVTCDKKNVVDFNPSCDIRKYFRESDVPDIMKDMYSKIHSKNKNPTLYDIFNHTTTKELIKNVQKN